MKKLNPLPVMAKKCKTCPFRPGSPYDNLAMHLTECALSEASRICHSTGNSAILGKTGKPERLCRGTRDIQLDVFHRLGVIDEPTDAAWAAKVDEINAEA